MEQREFIVEQETAGQRIDRFLSGEDTGLSRSALQALVAEGHVQCNGKTVAKSLKLKAGDTVLLEIPDAKPIEAVPQDIPLEIVYEDAHLLVVNKPKGMVVHPAPGNPDGTLVNALLWHCKGSLSGIGGEIRPGIVHRIDMDTTGVLIVCKNDKAHNAIAEQLKVHSITRKYYAIVHGVIKEDDGTVNAPIGRHLVDRKKMSINEKNGKEAVTHYHVLKRFRRFTYVECQLETGRTHQIRVHMSHIPHPLVGDQVYGGRPRPPKGASEEFITALRKFDRQALHATMLRLYHPISGIEMEWHAPIPQDMVELIEAMRADFEAHKDDIDWL